MNNNQIAEKFNAIADLLQIKGEVVYKVLAYRKAAESIHALGMDIKEIWKGGELTDIPGVGKAISEKIDELLKTGELEFLNRLTEELPLSLTDLLKVPDLGPKKVALIWRETGIKNLEELKKAAEEGELQVLPGLGAKSEEKIIAGIESLSRRTKRYPLWKVWPLILDIKRELKAVKGVHNVEVAGSFRRRRETIGDLDILATSQNSEGLLQAFTENKKVSRVISRGKTKASVEYVDGTRAQLWVHPPERYGSALQYATGSKAHNVRLRELAKSKGYSLSEHGFVKKDGSEILCPTEEEVYSALGLPWIPPELREDKGEIEVALKDKLPRLIQSDDIHSELHSHTTWSDGAVSIREMAQEAINRGYRILAITDHSVSLGIASGLKPEELLAQRQEINKVNTELGDQIKILHGAEIEIRSDGELDYGDEILAGLDIVIASLHVGLRQPKAKVTRRLLNAIENPHVDIIAHPTGRLIPDREGADLDMEAVLNAAAKTGIALEINANPNRLDLNDIYARRAAEMGIPIAINTDAHHPDEFNLIQFGIATARRAWMQKEQVINCWSDTKLLKWLKQRR